MDSEFLQDGKTIDETIAAKEKRQEKTLFLEKIIQKEYQFDRRISILGQNRISHLLHDCFQLLLRTLC